MRRRRRKKSVGKYLKTYKKKVMCEHNFITRLKKMQDAERAVERKELALSKAAMKYCVSLNMLKERIKKESVPSADKKRLQQLEASNRRLRIALTNEEAAFEKCKEENLRLQKEYQLHTAQAFEEQEEYTAYKEKLKILQQISNIHINAKALPDVMQGIVVREGHQGRNWIPFRLSTTNFDKQQIRQILWNSTQNTEINDQQ